MSSPSSVAARPAAARRVSPPRGAGGRPRCGGRRRAAGSRPSPATRAGRAAGARATPAAPPAAPPAARPRRRRSPRPAGPGPRAPAGTRARSAPSSSRRVGSSITPRQSSEDALPHDLPDVDPLVQRLPARAGLGGDVGRELDRALVRIDVDHPPAGDQVAGLGMRAVGGDGRGVRAAVAHPGARRRERLRVDVLAVLLEQLADVMLEGHVRLHVLGGPLVHRGHGTVRLRAAAVVLEQQVLRHRGSPGVVGRACRGPSPGERSRSALLDMESLIQLPDRRAGGARAGTPPAHVDLSEASRRWASRQDPPDHASRRGAAMPDGPDTPQRRPRSRVQAFRSAPERHARDDGTAKVCSA